MNTSFKCKLNFKYDLGEQTELDSELTANSSLETPTSLHFKNTI